MPEEHDPEFDHTFARILDRGHVEVVGYNEAGEALYALTEEGVRYCEDVLGLSDDA